MKTRKILCILSTGALALPCAAQEGASTMGHARARHLAEMGRLPQPGDVVIEDIVNYHRHRLPPPRSGELVSLDVRFGNTSARRHGPAVLQIGIATPKVYDRRDLPPLNLAVVVDCSGSMKGEEKIGRVRQGLLRLVDELRETDRFALVTYSSEAEVCMPSTQVGDGRRVREAIESLRADGSTNLHAGLMLGYKEVAREHRSDAANRVILLTDGIANAGVTDAREIARDSSLYNSDGIDLSTIGVGTDFNRDLLGTLAKSGRGLFHFVADHKDLDKVFVEEVQSLVAPIGREVRAVIDFPDELELVRVFGYEPRASRGRCEIELDDFNYGLTQVILMKFEVADWRRFDDALDVHVELSWRDADTGRRERSSKMATVEVGGGRGADPVRDSEVRKNYTIAVLAQAMHSMAHEVKRERFGEAERELRRAISFARERYPHAEDTDISRVLRMAEAYDRTLRNQLESFRRD